jgi:uncharacterized protein HemX
MRDYDTQLLESVAVRRRRLRDAVLFGSMRSRRSLDQNLTKAFIGLVLAAAIGAGAVGWSFVQEQRTETGSPLSGPTMTTSRGVGHAGV